MDPLNIEFDRKEIIRNEIERENRIVSEPEERLAKYADMLVSPFNFYRATAHLFFRDIGAGVVQIPSEWKNSKESYTWIQGDLHSQNLGYFDNSLGEVKFDLNDFDESYIGPSYWDLIRFMSALYLQREELDFECSVSDTDELALKFLEEYQETMEKIQEDTKYLERELTEEYLNGFLKDRIKDLQFQGKKKTAVKKWCTEENGKLIFDLQNIDLRKLDKIVWDKIYSTVSVYSVNLKEKYQVQDITRRINSGLGSQGMKKYYILMKKNKDEQFIIAELKEQKSPSMFLAGEISEKEYSEKYKSHSERSAAAMNSILKNADSFVAALKIDGLDFIIKKISDYKTKFKPEEFSDKSDFKNFIKYSAKATAIAHCRAQRYVPSRINTSFEDSVLNYLNKLPDIKEHLCVVSRTYADQVFSDFVLFKELISEKSL
ncbi:MAG TPA: DUF2252 family protein [Leptospiraceae bacterium]|nr:DUF2252 family protein [Leptospiraceae bacterium]